MAPSLILEADNITKRFPGVCALDCVSLEVRHGEVHAVVGENGAGKSTLMHILGGVFAADEGDVRVEGNTLRFHTAADAARAGISVVFQELSLVPSLSIAENIFANRQPVRALDWIDAKRLRDDARAMMQLFDMDAEPGLPVRRLPPAQQQVVEILKALSQRPKVLILDEPTSSLTSREADKLFENLRRLKGDGVSCIYISHNLPEIFKIADRVTVLRDGRRVDTCDIGGVTEASLVRKMVGRELSNMFGERKSSIGAAFFRVRNAGRGGVLEDINLEVRAGEIVGMAGLVGAGRTELGRAIAGVEPFDRGEMVLDGQRIKVASPGEAIARRIGYLTEDRKQQGLFMQMTVRANCIAPRLRAFAGRSGFMRETNISAYADGCRRRFNIATPSVRQRVANLSGGNQQKVLLAMWTGIDPRLLIIDEPTRGIDIGAKSDIYGHLRAMASAGVGILMISSDLTEILGLCDRVMVMKSGRIVAALAREQATEEAIIAAASGIGAVGTAGAGVT